MFSRTDVNIPLFHDPEQVSLRLLELPPDLLACVTSSEPPVFSLKSANASSDTSSGHAGSAQAVLCSQDKTCEIKQVQSSNTLLLLRPSIQEIEHEHSVTALSAFATCTGTLELLPITVDSNANSPGKWLVSLLPVYGRDTGVAAVLTRTKAALFEDIPFSDGELQAAWTSLVAFETQMKCFRPSAGILLESWKAVSASAAASGFTLTGLTGPFRYQRLVDDIGGFPTELIEAMLAKLCSEETSNQREELNLFELDRSRTVTWLGNIYLEAAGIEELLKPVPTILDGWIAIVPEEWQGDLSTDRVIQLERYRHIAQHLGSTTIEAVSQDVNSDSIRKPAQAPRNWHDKSTRSKG